MSTRARQHEAVVVAREQVSPHLARVVLQAPGFASTGIPDEWVGLVVPGQFQSRYYTVRDLAGTAEVPLLTLDVVVHDHGLVTEWVAGDVVGERVVISEARGSFDPPPDAAWLLLVGDLTALPAMARIARETDLPTRAWVDADELPAYLGERPEVEQVTWLSPPSDLSAVVAQIDWPAGSGYFWMAGESAQMRAIRKHLMRERRLPPTAYDVMGYWRGGATRQPRAVDPGPIYRAGKAAGKSDEQIWADYDAAREDATP